VSTADTDTTAEWIEEQLRKEQKVALNERHCYSEPLITSPLGSILLMESPLLYEGTELPSDLSSTVNRCTSQVCRLRLSV